MKATITIQEVKDLAMAKYCKGGDRVVECWDDKDIQEAIDSDKPTKAEWLKLFRFYNGMYSDGNNGVVYRV